MVRTNFTWRALLVVTIGVSALRCAGTVRPTSPPHPIPMSAWWVQPDKLAARDLFSGPWDAVHAPDPAAQYTFVRPKTGGFNPGVVVRDPQGREWHVKQPSANHGDEGPSEVVLSRVLSALGYHQPPVYYLPSFTMRDGDDVRTERGGRFRLDEPSMKDMGEWSWQQNPFVGQRPYQGLLVILLMFNSSDLKNSNNTLYQVTRDGRTVEWYVVRDLGDALGKTGRFAPIRNDLEAFAEHPVHHGRERRLRTSSATTAGSTPSCCASGSRRPTWRGPVRSSEASASVSGRTRFAPGATRRTSPAGSFRFSAHAWRRRSGSAAERSPIQSMSG